jgi:riboflavin synthase alpha subunit
VNLEVDVLAKYTARLLSFGQTAAEQPRATAEEARP